MTPAFLADRAGRTVALVFALNGFIFGSWFARIPAVKEALGLGEGALGLALLGAPIGALAVMGFAGRLVAVHGAARVTFVASALLCLTLPGAGLAVDAVTLALALALLGAASGIMDIAMNAEAALLEQRAGRSIMVGFHAMFSVGGACGAAAGALGAAVSTPLPHFVVAAACGLAALLARRGTLPDDPLPGGAGPAFAWVRGALVPIAAIALIAMLAEGAAADWTAVYLRETLGTTPALAAMGYTGFALGMTAGRLAGDRLVDRLGDERVIRTSALVATLALACAVAVPWPLLAMACFAVLGLGLAVIVPICFRRAATVPGSTPGHGLAAVATLAYTGFLIGPPAIGLLAEAIGLGLGLAMIAALLLAIPLLLEATATK